MRWLKRLVVAAGGYVFRARVAGLANAGPGLILLHGFPATSAMWLRLIEAAAAAGYRVVAFDQRGYSPGARPRGVSNYEIPELVGDVLAVADAFGFERFHLVGHDWGAVVGWSTVMQHPERVRSWAALSIPHVGVFIAAMREDMPSYIDLIRVPWLPEALLTFNRFALMRPSIEWMPPDQGRDYLAVFSEPGALTAAINWYRALPESIRAAAELILGPYQEIELDAGHSLIEEEPEVVEAIRFSLTARAASRARQGRPRMLAASLLPRSAARPRRLV